MPRPEKIVKFEGEILRETEKAILFKTDTDEVWLPRSQILNDGDLPVSGVCTVEIPEWLAEEKNLG